MDKQQFDQAIGEVPPSTVDVDAVIAMQRRAALVRRVVNPWVATAAGVVAITVGVAGAVMPGTDPGGAGIPANPPASATSSTKPAAEPAACPDTRQREIAARAAGQSSAPVPVDQGTPTPQAPPPAESPAAAAARLTGVLTAAVRARIPAGAQLTSNPANYPVDDPQHAPLEVVWFNEPVAGVDPGCTSYFLAGASIVQSGRTGSIQALIGRLGYRTTPMDGCAAGVRPEGSSCQARRGPAGEIIVLETLADPGGRPTVRFANVTKPDGTGIILTATNAPDPKRSERATSPVQPFTFEQLVDIALDPGLTLYPG